MADADVTATYLPKHVMLSFPRVVNEIKVLALIEKLHLGLLFCFSWQHLDVIKIVEAETELLHYSHVPVVNRHNPARNRSLFALPFQICH